MVEDQEGAISDTGEACKEVPLRPSYKHPGREGLQLAWMAAEQEKAQPVRGETLHAGLFQRFYALVHRYPLSRRDKLNYMSGGSPVPIPVGYAKF